MIKTVLLVDDDREMLLALNGGFSNYTELFTIQLAADGLEAVEKLKQRAISLVVTGLKMPGMDGHELLSHIREFYPDIPVIVMTGNSTPEMERLAREGGAVGYMAKPFLIENLAHQITSRLRMESEGGKLHNVSSGMFLQLVEMEEKTAIIRLEDNLTGKRGVLFFHQGSLLDARVNDLQGEAAACEIFSWDHVNLAIQNGCTLKKKRIQSELQPLLFEAARRKDEDVGREVPPSVLAEMTSLEVDPDAYLKRIKDRVETAVGSTCGIEDIYQDDSWNSQIFQFSSIGEFFGIGELMLAYIDKEALNDYIVIPADNTTVIAVNPKCQRDKLLQALSD